MNPVKRFGRHLLRQYIEPSLWETRELAKGLRALFVPPKNESSMLLAAQIEYLGTAALAPASVAGVSDPSTYTAVSRSAASAPEHTSLDDTARRSDPVARGAWDGVWGQSSDEISTTFGPRNDSEEDLQSLLLIDHTPADGEGLEAALEPNVGPDMRYRGSAPHLQAPRVLDVAQAYLDSVSSYGTNTLRGSARSAVELKAQRLRVVTAALNEAYANGKDARVAKRYASMLLRSNGTAENNLGVSDRTLDSYVRAYEAHKGPSADASAAHEPVERAA